MSLVCFAKILCFVDPHCMDSNIPCPKDTAMIIGSLVNRQLSPPMGGWRGLTVFSKVAEAMAIGKFSNSQLAGQRLMVGFEGVALNPDLQRLIREFKVGGLILFSRNLKTPDQIKELCRSTQDFAQSCGLPPLFIAIDQEGGEVVRLREPFTQFPGNPHMKSVADAIHFSETTAAELCQVGININMAPVVDVVPEDFGSIMAGRSFGGDPHWVSRLGVKVVEHLQQNHIMAVAKHFPGIGRTSLDSHLEMPILDDDLQVLQRLDLVPFEACIQHGVCGIMLSHIFYRKLDPIWPASLSSKIARDLLRDRMGFDGIVFTDDLDMGAIAKHFDIRTVIQQILLADIDISLICRHGPNIATVFEEILRMLRESPAMKAKALESVKRIMRLKRKYLGASHFEKTSS
jgi:beta-N-acetylhexosaminidase